MKAVYSLLIVLGLMVVAHAARHQILTTKQTDSQYTFAILSDIHIGESPAVSALNDTAVNSVLIKIII